MGAFVFYTGFMLKSCYTATKEKVRPRPLIDADIPHTDFTVKIRS